MATALHICGALKAACCGQATTSQITWFGVRGGKCVTADGATGFHSELKALH